MITLASVGSASSAAEYYSADNYYTADQTQDASAWFGKGAEVLGLVGKVEEAAFAAVLVKGSNSVGLGRLVSHLT